MLKKIAVVLIAFSLLSSCSAHQYDRLKISATTWVGYSPLFYAKGKGWLKSLNIKLLHVVSLSENMYLYQAGNSDAYVGTQYEYSVLSPKSPTLFPVMMFDRSYGGDIVMGNASIETLQTTSKTIHAYLEMDSINRTLLKDFLKKYHLENKPIKYINQDQAITSGLTTASVKKPSLIVTYTPFNVRLADNGFHELASTRDNLDLLVVDGMFTTQEKFDQHRAQFVELKKLIDKAVVALKKNPKEYYKTVKPYLLELSYHDFMQSLHDIIWINTKLSKSLEARLKQSDFPTQGLL